MRFVGFNLFEVGLEFQITPALILEMLADKLGAELFQDALELIEIIMLNRIFNLAPQLAVGLEPLADLGLLAAPAQNDRIIE